MARGRLLRTKKKEAYEIAKQAALGKADGEAAAQLKKKTEVSLKEHVGKFIDRLTTQDVIKLVEIGTIAYMIKPIIQLSPELVSKVQSLGKMASLETLTTGILALWQGPKELLKWGLETAQPWIEKNALSDQAAWVLSFGVACLIVEFGPVMLQSIGGVAKIAGLLIS